MGSTDLIPVFKPLLEKAETDAAVRTLEVGWLGMGKSVGQFEQELAKYLGLPAGRHIVALSTGHAALHLGLLLAGVKPGDEVLTPSFNNIADFQAILAVGAQPVFCDIDPDTLCIDVKAAEALISPRTKVIIPMDYDCLLCDHDAVAELAARHNLRVLHDAAHSIGSKYKGKMVGTFSDFTMFSFDPVKTITCLDGGALVVRSQEEVTALHNMRLVGMGQPAAIMYQNQRAWTYDVTHMGFRYHMSNMHAAIGLAQLAKMDRISSTRREACLTYNHELGKIAEVITPKTDFKDITSFLYYIRVPAPRRDWLRAFLLERGVDTGIHWQPGHWFTLFKNCRKGPLPVTDKIGHEILSLPLHSGMQQETVRKVTGAISDFFAAKI